MKIAKAAAVFVDIALTEIVGNCLPYRWLRQGRSARLLIPAAMSFAAFAWLLTLHPTASGRTYVAYGGVYITVALAWLWLVDGIRPTRTDLTGFVICHVGMEVIMSSRPISN